MTAEQTEMRQGRGFMKDNPKKLYMDESKTKATPECVGLPDLLGVLRLPPGDPCEYVSVALYCNEDGTFRLSGRWAHTFGKQVVA